MAIYHLSVKIISRGKGRNAVASIAYRRAAKIFDEQCNRTWNYENKPGVIHSEISVPEDSPIWVKSLVKFQQESDQSNRKSRHLSSQHLWNLVEKTERRVDARLAREIEFALPVELNQEQSIVLAREFISDQFVKRGMVADWSVHFDNRDNPHVHVMLTTRELAQSGFGKKVTEWNDKSLLFIWREKWAEYANFHLKLHQHNVRIDHRSYKDQRIDLIPTVHRGRASEEIEKRDQYSDRKAEEREIKKENLKKILEKPEVLAQKIFSSIEHHESVFSDRELSKALLAYVDNKQEFDSAFVKIKQSKDLIYLGVGEDGNARYTTRRMFEIENNLQKIADKLQTKNHIRISDRKIHNALEKYQTKLGKGLTSEQREGVEHLVSQKTIACVIGKAGAGKSFALGAANAVWKAKGLTVYGIALSGVAARNLAKESGIPSRTIESFRFCVENGIIHLTPKDVIVMDEAGMTDSVAMEAVLKAVDKSKAKLALVGDYAQLQPVGPGAAFRALIERLNIQPKILKEVYRQNHDWQKKATTYFAEGDMKSGINLYHDKGFICIEKNEDQAKQKLVDDWDGLKKLQSLIKKQDLKDYLVLAHRNKDVDELNQLIRQKRLENQEISEGYSVSTSKGKINISQGDRILLRENNTELAIKNGQFAEIKKVNFSESGHVRSFSIALDSDPSKETEINPSYYKNFTYGYAATVHKSQGATVEHSFVYLGGRWWNRNLTYVAMTRHKESCHVYSDQNTHKNIESLKSNVNRKARKDSVLDYPIAFTERRGINTENLLQKLPEYIAEKLKQIHDKIREKIAAKFSQLTQTDTPFQSENQIYTRNQNQSLEKMSDQKSDQKLDRKPETLTDLLKRYVNYQVEQEKLIYLAGTTKFSAPEESKIYANQYRENKAKINDFIQEVAKRPDIQESMAALKNMQNPKFIKLSELRGFKAIAERMNKDNERSLELQDSQALLVDIRGKILAAHHAQTQGQERSRRRGGRSL